LRLSAPNPRDPVSKQLVRIWKNFAGRCDSRFEEEGLLSPLEPWILDNEVPEERSWFKSLAEILKKGTEDPKSREAKFIHDMRALVIQARAEAKEVIETDREKRFPLKKE